MSLHLKRSKKGKARYKKKSETVAEQNQASKGARKKAQAKKNYNAIAGKINQGKIGSKKKLTLVQ